MYVKSRCHRTLRKLEGFKRPDELPLDLPAFLLPDEIGLGAYVNPNDDLVFALSNWAIYISDKDTRQFRKLLLSDLAKVSTPDTDRKERAETLVLEDRYGSRFTLTISGGQGNFRDLFEVLRFFKRVREDAIREGRLESINS
jgi:hypothetical protein